MPRYALEVLVLILLVLWLVGLFVPFAGNFIHVLLILVLCVVGLRVVQGRKPVA